MTGRILALVLLTFGTAGALPAQGTRLLRQPTISATAATTRTAEIVQALTAGVTPDPAVVTLLDAKLPRTTTRKVKLPRVPYVPPVGVGVSAAAS